MSEEDRRDGWQPEGPKWAVLYGSYEGVERSALHLVQSGVQRFLPYVVPVRHGGDEPPVADEHVVLMGTPDSNKWIGQLVGGAAIPPPPSPQGYTVACLESPFREGRRVLMVAGGGPAGVLHGAHELLARVLSDGVWPDLPARSQDGYGTIGPVPMTSSLEKIPALATSGAPAIEYRGIWTWGYAIYDYRRFFDRMARLKMNMVTIWNNSVPLNANEVIECAHARGIRVIMGFHWGWGRNE